MATMNVTVEGGMAFLPDGSVINLLEIQSRLNAAFQETGDTDLMNACDELSRITLHHQGPHGDFVPGSYFDGENERDVGLKGLPLAQNTPPMPKVCAPKP